MGEGETSRTTADIDKREKQAREAAAAFGAKEVILDKLPDQRFDTVPFLEIVQRIEKLILEKRYDFIYTNSPYDLNLDHRITSQAVITACRPGPGFPVKKILTFEVLSSTEWQIKDQANAFSPTAYENISDFIEEKIGIFKIYADEAREYPHPRSAEGIKILARYRGMQVGYPYAEAFQLIRELSD